MSLGNDRFQCSEPTKTFRCGHTQLEENATTFPQSGTVNSAKCSTWNMRGVWT